MRSQNDFEDVRHLVLRAGFGFSPRTCKMTMNESRGQVLKQIFEEAEAPHYMNIAADSSDDYKAMSAELRQEKRKQMRQELDQMNVQWLKFIQDSMYGLREKMTLFWHGHFACRVNNSLFMQQYYNTLQKHALGNFSDLLREVSKSAAMLQFLNNQQNKKAHPNENFAREVMELFTLGRGNYTEHDVKESARAFTGWGYNSKGEFVFREKQHDEGRKSFLGKGGDFRGDDILDILLENPQTSIFITRKIYGYFVNETPDNKIIADLAKGFRESRYNIEMLLRKIFSSAWFYSPSNKGAIIKSPVELISNINRVNNVTVQNPKVFIQFEKLLGQVLFNPPNVAGWSGGRSWIDSSSLMLRMRLPAIIFYDESFVAQAKVAAADLDTDFGNAQKQQELINRNYLDKANQRVGATLEWEPYLNVFDNISDDKLFDAVLAYHINIPNSAISRDVVINKGNRVNYIKGLTSFIMSSPEYQLT